MKIILLQHLSGALSYAPGEEIEVDDLQALRMIEKGIAKAKTQKAHNDLVSKAQKLRDEESEKQSKIIAIQKEKELKEAADELLTDLLAIVSTLATIDPGYRDGFLEKFHAAFVEVDAITEGEGD